MKAIAVLAALLVVLFIGYCVFLGMASMWEEHQRSRTGATDPRARKIRSNHVAMAGWITQVLNDGDIRPFVPQELQTAGRDLLGSFHDEGADA